MNREALDAITLGAADGLHALGVRVVERARPIAPDAPPIGKGLPGGGMVVTQVRRKKVAGYGPTAKLPRRDPAPKEAVATWIGFTFPGRFQETGTVNMPANPFLTPSLAAEAPSAGEAAAAGIKAKLRGVK